MRLLAILASLKIFASTGLAQQNFECVKDAINKIGSISSYSTKMQKNEWLTPQKKTSDLIFLNEHLSEKTIEVTYLNQGSTGIKNNEMTVKYSGGHRAALKLGKSKGFGNLLKPFISLFSRSEISIFDPLAIDDEIFTVNRAGFGFLLHALNMHLEQLISGEFGTLKAQDNSGCMVQYNPKPNLYAEEKVSSSADIITLENKYGTLAYIIYLANRAKFKSFADMFKITHATTLLVPINFAQFNLVIDAESKIPKEFYLYQNDEVIGEYRFQDTKVVSK